MLRAMRLAYAHAPNYWASGASPPSGSVGAIFRYIYISSSSQCACVTCARFYLVTLYTISSLLASLRIPSSSSSAKGERERASCPRICASSSVVRPREREATETAEEREGQLDVVCQCGTGLY